MTSWTGKCISNQSKPFFASASAVSSIYVVYISKYSIEAKLKGKLVGSALLLASSSGRALSAKNASLTFLELGGLRDEEFQPISYIPISNFTPDTFHSAAVEKPMLSVCLSRTAQIQSSCSRVRACRNKGRKVYNLVSNQTSRPKPALEFAGFTFDGVHVTQKNHIMSAITWPLLWYCNVLAVLASTRILLPSNAKAPFAAP